MLCDEYRMTLEGGLFSIVERSGGRQSLGDQVVSVLNDSRKAFRLQILGLARTESLSLPKR